MTAIMISSNIIMDNIQYLVDNIQALYTRIAIAFRQIYELLYANYFPYYINTILHIERHMPIDYLPINCSTIYLIYNCNLRRVSYNLPPLITHIAICCDGLCMNNILCHAKAYPNRYQFHTEPAELYHVTEGVVVSGTLFTANNIIFIT
jgi:hypothetical protein